MTEGNRPPRDPNRRLLHVTCAIHGARGFCDLVVTKINGEIALNPHVDNSCVLILDEVAAITLHQALREWLR